MAFSETELAKVHKTMAAFIEKHRPPEHLREKVDLAYRVTDQAVEIFEIRPRWNKPKEKQEEAVAKARYFKSRDNWTVYWERADLKWHIYEPNAEVKSLSAFLSVVEKDEYGCFFG
jgi:hypothetical protein